MGSYLGAGSCQDYLLDKLPLITVLPEAFKEFFVLLLSPLAALFGLEIVIFDY
jgi:hypothetical protein